MEFRNVHNSTEFKNTLNKIKTCFSAEFIIRISSDFSLDPIELTDNKYDGKIITIRSSGAVQTISLSSQGSLFTVGSSVAKPTLILENITLKGKVDNHSSLISVKGGMLILRTGGKINGNKTSAKGGGVYVGDGHFEMNEGKISGNSSKSDGGGVCVDSGSFEMNGGTISGNTVSGSDSYGGGVYVNSSGIFTKAPAAGSTASGIIYGSDATEEALKNTAKTGAAVYRTDMKPINNTVEQKDNITEKWAMPLTRKQYDDLFLGDKEILKAALDRAWSTRNFEIDKFWTRTAFFGGFISVIFVGYVNIITRKDNIDILLTNLDVYLILLGIIFSFAWLFAIFGSKNWQENWEAHIEMLENKITGPLYKTINCKHTPFYSVSKINIFLSIVIIVVWIVMLIQTLVKKVLDKNISCCILIGAILAMITATFFIYRNRKYYDKLKLIVWSILILSIIGAIICLICYCRSVEENLKIKLAIWILSVTAIIMSAIACLMSCCKSSAGEWEIKKSIRKNLEKEVNEERLTYFIDRWD